MAISDADIRILTLLAKFRFVPVETIRREVFANQSRSTAVAYTSRRLSKLRDSGLVQSQAILGKSHVHFLTDDGAKFMGVEGGAGVGIKLAEFAHDCACVDAYLSLFRRGDRPGLITEREARALSFDPETNSYAIPITRVNGAKGYAWPDMVSGEDGQFIGYEVEWTKKSKRRLIHLMHGYGYSDHYRMGIYLTTPDSHSVVSSACEEANDTMQARGLGRPIAVFPLNNIIANDKGGNHE